MDYGICSNCGVKFTEETLFCPECGTRYEPPSPPVIEKAEESPADAAPQGGMSLGDMLGAAFGDDEKKEEPSEGKENEETSEEQPSSEETPSTKKKRKRKRKRKHSNGAPAEGVTATDDDEDTEGDDENDEGEEDEEKATEGNAPTISESDAALEKTMSAILGGNGPKPAEKKVASDAEKAPPTQIEEPAVPSEPKEEPSKQEQPAPTAPKNTALTPVFYENDEEPSSEDRPTADIDVKPVQEKNDEQAANIPTKEEAAPLPVEKKPVEDTPTEKGLETKAETGERSVENNKEAEAPVTQEVNVPEKPAEREGRVFESVDVEDITPPPPVTPSRTAQPQNNGQPMVVVTAMTPEDVYAMVSGQKRPSEQESSRETFDDEAKKEEETEILSMSDEQHEEARKRLHKMCISTEMEQLLVNTVSPSTRGLRAFFIGEPGTKKEKKIEELTKLLYDIGKLKSAEPAWITFGNIPKDFETGKMYVIDDLSTAVTQLFNLDDFSDEASQQQIKYKKLLERLLRAPRTTYIILNGRDTEKKGFVVLDGRIPYVFDRTINFPDLTNKEISDRIIKGIPKSHIAQVTPELGPQIEEYLERNRRFFPFNNQDLANYIIDYSTRQSELTLPQEKYNPATLEQAFSTIIGMETVKNQVRELEQYLRVQKELKAAGATPPAFNLHMMFTGNPGVGKTTIARIVSKTLFELGFCREDKLVEVTTQDLVDGSNTGRKTARAIQGALGGVLFVDEAYALNNCGQAGAEAIAIIIKAMMDYKGSLVVMFAGYAQEMRIFVDSNSGIASRINYIFKFEDYTQEELLEIWKLRVRLCNMKATDEANKAVEKLCGFAAGRKNAGNGRFIDNTLQKAFTKHALLDLAPEDKLTFQKASIPAIDEVMALTSY